MSSIIGYENYLIFKDGVIINANTGKEIKPNLYNGYYQLNLSNNNKKIKKYIHRIVAEAFIPNPENKPCIDHKNRIKTDNRIENLRWVTHLENMQNKSDYKNNTCGTSNVYYDKINKRWRYDKTINKVRHLKWFKTEQEAIDYKHIFES